MPSALARIQKQLAQSRIDRLLGDRINDPKQERKLFIEAAYREGGKLFLSQVKLYGCNEKREDLRIDPWYEEALLLIGDLRISHALTTGCAQIGKTLSHTLLMCWLISQGKINAGWFYATQSSMDLNVPEQFRPVVEEWVNRIEIATGKKIASPSDRQLTSRWQVGGSTAIFSYVSTTKTTASRSGLARAGGAAVSFTANLLIYEERSQWPVGCADPLPRRLDASCLPSKPIRELGTPGGGSGIEAELKLADYHFYPHYTCAKCGSTLPLDPKGCLIQAIVRRNALGQEEKGYLSESGRPAKWFHAHENEAVDSAYIGCSRCGHPIPESDRVNAWMQCLRSGITAKEFIKSLPPGVPSVSYRVGVHFSPLCRRSSTNLAADIIRSGLECSDTTDWQQQRLGHPSENQIAGLTQEIISNAIGLPVPRRDPDYILAGVDQGRAEDWLSVIAFYLPEEREGLSATEIIEKSVREVRFCGDVMRSDIPELLERFNVSFGIIDNEPNRESAMELCRITKLQMADQKTGMKEVVKEDKVKDGGATYPSWFIRSEKFLVAVLHGFLLVAPDGHQLYRLPESWRKWQTNKSDRSPFIHFTGPHRDPGTGDWKRGSRNIDDMYYATMFCESAFYIQVVVARRIVQPEFGF